jgi:hypothetical protein
MSNLLDDMVPRLVPFEPVTHEHVGKTDEKKTQLWVLRRAIQAKRSEVSELMSKAGNLEGEVLVLAALYDSLPKCGGCSGEGKVMVSDEEARRVYAETCEECGGSGEA